MENSKSDSLLPPPEEHISDAIDRFTSLPDQLILVILSYLPFLDVVRTSLTSTKLGSFLFSARRIELDETLFVSAEKRAEAEAHDDAQDTGSVTRQNGRSAFVEFARRFCRGYGERKKVKSFRLCFSRPVEYDSDVRKWLSIATEREAEELDLDFSDPEMCHVFPDNFMGYYHLPEDVYVGLSDSLRVLKLAGCHFKPLRFSEFNALRSLTMARVEFSSNSLNKLTQNCKHLKHLTLKNCNALDSIDIIDQNVQMETVVIDDCDSAHGEVCVASRNLVSFKYTGSLLFINLQLCPRLEEVEIDFGLEYDFLEFADLLLHFLHQLEGVKVLTLCSYFVQIFSAGPELSTMEIVKVNISHLILRTTSLHPDELPGINLLLRSFPRLQTLTIEMGNRRILDRSDHQYVYQMDEHEFLEDCKNEPIECLQHHLKKIKVEGFRGRDDEVSTFLQILLWECRVLEEFAITVSKDPLPSETIEQYMTVAHQIIEYRSSTSPTVHFVIN